MFTGSILLLRSPQPLPLNLEDTSTPMKSQHHCQSSWKQTNELALTFRWPLARLQGSSLWVDQRAHQEEKAWDYLDLMRDKTRLNWRFRTY